MHNYFIDDPKIVIIEMEYLKQLNNLLKKTDKKIIVNYILWRYTLEWSNQLDERHDDLKQVIFYLNFIKKNKK